MARSLDGASLVVPSSTNFRPVAWETSAIAAVTSSAPPGGAPAGRVTKWTGRHGSYATGVPSSCVTANR